MPLWAQENAPAPIKMAYVEFPPYSSTDHEGQPQGLSIDLAQHLAQVIGRGLEFVKAENPGAMVEMVHSGAVDMSTLLGLTANRLELTLGTQPLGQFEARLFAKRRWGDVSLSSFAGKKVGAVVGSLGVAAAQQLPFATIIEYSSPDAVTLALLADDIDGMIADYGSAIARLRQLGVDTFIETVQPPLLQAPYGFLVSPNNPNFLRTLDDAIKSNITAKELRALDEIWFGRPTWHAEHYTIAAGGILTVLMVFSAISIYKRFRKEHHRANSIFQKSKANQLLVDALDGVDAAIVIYDKTFSTVHWNNGFGRAFPKMVPGLKKGKSLESLISTSYQNGTTAEKMNKSQADGLAGDVIRRLEAGETVTRDVQMQDGRLFEAVDLPIGEDHYASVRVEVTRLHDQAQTILSQKLELETANEQLRMFTAVAAHDLNAPLAQQSALLNFVHEDLKDADIILPPEVQSYLEIVDSLSKKMKKLVKDLLEYSHVEKTSNQIEEFDPNERLADIIEMAGLPSGFRVDVEGQLPIVCANPTAFDTVIRNLVSNAAKHHDKEIGRITIRAGLTDNCVHIEVEDDGPGIPEEYRESIFEPFKRLASTSAGSGLGLSFIKKAVEQWGGDVHIECSGPRGSTFVLSIPDTRQEGVSPAHQHRPQTARLH